MAAQDWAEMRLDHRYGLKLSRPGHGVWANYGVKAGHKAGTLFGGIWQKNCGTIIRTEPRASGAMAAAAERLGLRFELCWRLPMG